MTEIKFACPSCGQAIQCNPECANQNVPCPSCASLIRVPADTTLAELPGEANPFQSEETAKVSYAAAEEDHKPARKKPAQEATPKSQSAAASGSKEPATPPANPSEVSCVCPVCHSELQISLSAKSNGKPHRSGDRLAESSAFVAKPPPVEHLSAAERERKIAAAREAHPVLHPTAKPRLDRILSAESAKLEFVPPQMPNSAEDYRPEIDPDQLLRPHDSA